MISYKHKPAMDSAVYDAILPIYEELSREDRLNRCLGGFTKKTNESFHFKIWAERSLTDGSKNDSKYR